MIYTFTSFVEIAVGWSVTNRVSITIFNRTWSPRAMARVAVREIPYGFFRTTTSAREDVAPAPAMNWC